VTLKLCQKHGLYEPCVKCQQEDIRREPSSARMREGNSLTYTHLGNLKPHPKAADFNFPLSEEDRRELVKSIEAHGFKDAFQIKADGTLLDGHTRLEILKELGYPPETRVPVQVLSFETEEQEIEYLIRVNLARRHLSPAQRATLIAKPYPQAQAEAEARRAQAPAAPRGAIG